MEIIIRCKANVPDEFVSDFKNDKDFILPDGPVFYIRGCPFSVDSIVVPQFKKDGTINK